MFYSSAKCYDNFYYFTFPLTVHSNFPTVTCMPARCNIDKTVDYYRLVRATCFTKHYHVVSLLKCVVIHRFPLSLQTSMTPQDVCKRRESLPLVFVFHSCDHFRHLSCCFKAT